MDRMSSARPDGFRPVSSEEVRRKKTSFTLDFASNAAAKQADTVAAKRAKQELLNEGILRSPDVSLLALATPDLERLIMQQAYGASAAVATTPPGAGAANPSIVTTPTQVLGIC
jgi:Jun-like transcription factor